MIPGESSRYNLTVRGMAPLAFPRPVERRKGQEWQFCLDVLRGMSGAYVAHLSAIAQPGQDMESCDPVS